MSLEVHRSNRTMYPQTTTLLNVPDRQLSDLINRSDSAAVIGSRFLGIPHPDERGVFSSGPSPLGGSGGESDNSQSIDAQLDEILDSGLSPEEIVARLRESRATRDGPSSPSDPTDLEVVSGVPMPVWKRAAAELLDAVMPLTRDGGAALGPEQKEALRRAAAIGVKSVELITDFPIVMATYGFSRSEYRPNECQLNPFPADPHAGGRLPIYVDQVDADALFVRLDPAVVISWLQGNGYDLTLPSGSDPERSAQAYFVQLFDDTNLRATVPPTDPERRLVMGLLHSMSHLAVRKAALLSGLEQTSLSEFILPKALSFAIYCNHRSAATIGALTALFEQATEDWLYSIRDAMTCIYDPICSEQSAVCHACSHLPETSCRFFNLNLSRSYLFGGDDGEISDLMGFVHAAQG